jgi:diadenosine tetraphosphate (Ap4A) HIT family hydrolase
MYSGYIVASGRMSYVKGKKLQPYKGCILCGVAQDRPGVIKRVLYRDRLVMVIMNVFPYNVGHLQVVPIRHVESFDKLTAGEYAALWNMVRRSVGLLDKALLPKGYNIGFNLGGDIAGGSITHLHCQIVPRYARDAGFMEITADTKVLPQTLDDTFALLKKHAGLLRG